MLEVIVTVRRSVIMELYENETVELTEIYKEFVAFANTNGGIIYIGTG